MEQSQQPVKRGRKPKNAAVLIESSDNVVQIAPKRIRKPKVKLDIINPITALKSNNQKWDKSQISQGQWFCNHVYEKIVSIQPNCLSTKNQQGLPIVLQGDWQSSYAKYYSADQYQLEIPSNQTELSAILQQAGYTVFTVQFKKKLTEIELLDKLNLLQQNNENDISQCTKKELEGLFDGTTSTIRGYLLSNEEHLGRATVINLDAEPDNQIRLVDLRQIQFIIIRNIKYFLAKSITKSNANIQDTNINHFLDIDKLKKDDIIYSTQYLKVDKLYSNKVALVGDDSYDCELDIMHRDMWSASMFNQEKKSTITEVSEILKNAVTTCFTVCFNAKPQQSDIVKSINLKEFIDPKEIASHILKGRECVITCRLFDQSPKLGRSHVIELETKQHKQVDHRTINWVIFKNVKYVV